MGCGEPSISDTERDGLFDKKDFERRSFQSQIDLSVPEYVLFISLLSLPSTSLQPGKPSPPPPPRARVTPTEEKAAGFRQALSRRFGSLLHAWREARTGELELELVRFRFWGVRGVWGAGVGSVGSDWLRQSAWEFFWFFLSRGAGSGWRGARHLRRARRPGPEGTRCPRAGRDTLQFGGLPRVAALLWVLGHSMLAVPRLSRLHDTQTVVPPLAWRVCLAWYGW